MFQHAGHDGPLIPQPASTLPELRQAVATVIPARLPEFFNDMQSTFAAAGEQDSTLPIRMFYRRWGVTIAIERDPGTAARLHAAERALNDEDPEVRRQAIREAGAIARAAHAQVAGE
jgi:hypothetical protein